MMFALKKGKADNFDSIELNGIIETAWKHLLRSNYDYRFIKVPHFDADGISQGYLRDFDLATFAGQIVSTFYLQGNPLPPKPMQGLILRREGSTFSKLHGVKYVYEFYFIEDMGLVSKPWLLQYWKYQRKKYCYPIWGLSAIEVTGKPTESEMLQMIALYSLNTKKFHGLLNHRQSLNLLTVIFSTESQGVYSIAESDLNGNIERIVPASEYLIS